MMIFQVNVVSLAKITKAVGLMAGITPPHSRAGAKLREAEAPFETLVFVRDEPVIEIDAMRDKYPAMNCMKLSATSANTGAPCTMS
jgi:hypothetical protein